MNEITERNEAVSLCARLALFVADELEPLSEETLEEDLAALYQFVARVERTARKWRRARAH